MKNEELVENITNSIIYRKQKDKAMLVAFDGVDTSGKTTFANNVYSSLKLREIDSIRVSIDKFHNTKDIRLQKGEYSPEGFFYDSFNYDKIIEFIINPVKNRKTTITNGIYDYKKEDIIDQNIVPISENSIILFDGIFMHRNELKHYWDLSVFLDISFETVRKRAILRDKDYFGSEEKVLEKYNKRYIPGEEIYLSLCNPRSQADFVIDNNDWQNPVLMKGNFI